MHSRIWEDNLQEKTIAIAGNMSTRRTRRGSGGRQQRHNMCDDDHVHVGDDSTFTLHHTPSSSSSPSQRNNPSRGHRHQQQQPKYRFVQKSQLVPSSSNSDSDSCVTQQVDVDRDNTHASELNTDDDTSSKTAEGDNSDNIMFRLDKLLSNMEQPQLSEDQLIDNDQSQQNEVLNYTPSLSVYQFSYYALTFILKLG